MTSCNMEERVAVALQEYFANDTGFIAGGHGEGIVAAYYGGHWITLDTRKIARVALATINSTPDSNALREACDAAFDFLGGVDDASEIRYQLLAALLSSDPGRVE